MTIEVSLIGDAIEGRWQPPAAAPGSGAVVEFRGIVRGEEDGAAITALCYEAYETMAKGEMERILRDESAAHACERVIVQHRHGWIPVGEIAILVWIEAQHRGPAYALLEVFMNRLKRDVPIWKVEVAG